MKVFRRKAKGFTLIEAAVIILLLSIALIPVIKLVSNKAGSSAGDGLVTGVTEGRKLTQEQAIANAIMEKAIAGDISIMHPVMAQNGDVLSFDTNGNFVRLDADGNPSAAYLPENDLSPQAGNTPSASVVSTANRNIIYPKYQYQNSGFYYNWEVTDATMQLYDPDGTGTAPPEYKSFMPKGNNLVKAILRIYSGHTAQTASNASYSVSTYFFKNTSKALAEGDPFSDKIGIVLVVDTSLSMKASNYVGAGGNDFFFGSTFAFGDSAYTSYSNPTGSKIPLRMSSGLAGYDPAAIASPYLVYRPGVNDLYFAKTLDDPITPYDERYNPCAIPNRDLPYTGLAWDQPLPNSDYVTCTLNPPDVPAGREDLYLYLPTLPDVAIAANFGSPADFTAIFDYWDDPPSDPDPANSGCLNQDHLDQSTCSLYKTDGTPLFPQNWTYRMVMYDKMHINPARAALFGNPGDEDITSTYLSRIEAARTALLSFVLTIEGDSTLVNNFVVGFVPFSTEVQDGSYTLTTETWPDEVLQLSGPSGGTFNNLKSKLFRMNRACKYGTDNYPAGVPACPGGTQPLTLTGQTNLAHALYTANEQFNTYEAANDPLAKKIVILLTDGGPTASANITTGVPEAFTDIGSEVTKLGGLSAALETNDVSIYSVGLLVAGDVDAQQALGAIKGSNPDNNLVYVNSVGDLTPVFESIAQQAEMYVLQQMEQRYSYLW